MFSTYPRTRFGPFDSAATERATTPRATSEGIVTSRNEVRGPRKSAYWTVRSAPGGRSNSSRSSVPHSNDAEDLAEERELPGGAPRVGLAAAPRSRTRATPTPGSASPARRRRCRSWSAAARPCSGCRARTAPPWTPAMRACEGPLKSASRMAIRSPRARRAPARCSVSVLLPTPPLPEPTATRCRTPASPSAIRLR